MSLIQNLNTLYLFPGNITEGILYHTILFIKGWYVPDAHLVHYWMSIWCITR